MSEDQSENCPRCGKRGRFVGPNKEEGNKLHSPYHCDSCNEGFIVVRELK